MKTRHVIVTLWVALATFGLGRLWIARPDLGPQFPSWFGGWFVSVTGGAHQESASDAEAALLYAICLIVVSLLTWIALLLVRRRWQEHRKAR